MCNVRNLIFSIRMRIYGLRRKRIKSERRPSGLSGVSRIIVSKRVRR